MSSLSASVFRVVFGVLLVGLLLCDLVTLLNSFGSMGSAYTVGFLGDSFAFGRLEELDPALDFRW